MICPLYMVLTASRHQTKESIHTSPSRKQRHLVVSILYCNHFNGWIKPDALESTDFSHQKKNEVRPNNWKVLMSASPLGTQEAPRPTIWVFLYLSTMKGGHMPNTWTAVKTVIFGSRMTCGWHVHMCKCVEYWHIRVHCSWTIYWWLRGFKIESIWKKKQPRVYLGKSRLISSVQHVN